MAAATLFTCVCGVQKKETNHWVLARVEHGRVVFSAWNDLRALDDDIVVLCGEGCAAALLSRALGEWKHQAADVRTLVA